MVFVISMNNPIFGLFQMIIGPFLTSGDLESNILEVFSSWHLGMEEDPSWEKSVINQVPNLFSMASVDASGRSGGRNLYRSILLNHSRPISAT